MLLKINFVPFAILTFCLHQIGAQENYQSDGSVKAPRHLTSNRGSIKFTSNYVSQEKLVADDDHGKLQVDDTPDEFDIQKPAKKDKSYDDFLSFLYRNDKTKSKVKRSIESDASLNDSNDRGKRMIIFRPLFVYKQQQIRREKVVADKRRKTKPNTKPNRNQG